MEYPHALLHYWVLRHFHMHGAVLITPPLMRSWDRWAGGILLPAARAGQLGSWECSVPKPTLLNNCRPEFFFINSSVSFFFMPRDARGVRTPVQRVRWHSTGPDRDSGRAAALPGPGAGRAVAATARLLTSYRVLLGCYVCTGCLLVVWLVQGCVGSCCHQHTVAIIMTTACFIVWEPLTLNV